MPATETHTATTCTCSGDVSLPCDLCDQPGVPGSVFGDADGDYDAAELALWMATYGQDH